MLQVQNEHIVATKLVVPVSPARMVLRPRLLPPEENTPVILLCAPAGYGKTTLISSWIKNLSVPIAWLSLDSGDNAPDRFLMHLVGTIQRQMSDFGDALINAQGVTPTPPISILMRLLVNELCVLSRPLVLVFDDLHVIQEPTIQEAIAFLVQYRPPALQLILATRTDPAFPLARLRAQRQLLEYRTEDLRFTLSEAEQFCNEIMNLDLNPDLVRVLDDRTEGWIAGLQLAALSLRNNHDSSSFIHDLAGNSRHITDFLIEEVLRNCSENTQQFLLHTSLFERFCAPLCDAVFGNGHSRAMIDELEQNNMFIMGLDNKRLWYRYHQLFASLLQSRLAELEPEQTNALHRLASQWFSNNGCFSEAIEHAIKASDYNSAAQLMETHSAELFSLGRFVTVRNWVQPLPEGFLAQHPQLAMTCAWAELVRDNPAGASRYVQAASASLSAYQDGPIGTTERMMFGQMSLLQGCQYCREGKLAEAMTCASEALASLLPGQVLYRTAAVCLGICHYVRGELDVAQPLLETNTGIAEARRNLIVPIFAVLALGRSHVLRGQLSAARQVYEKALQECIKLGWQDMPVCGILHIGLGEVAYQMDRLDVAEQQLVRGVGMTAVGGVKYVNAWGQVLLAQTRLATGLTDQGFKPEQEAALMGYSGRFVVDIPPLSAALARLWFRQGRMDMILHWQDVAQLPADSQPAIEREAEYLIRARYLIANQQMTKALELLECLTPSVENGKRHFVLLEILLLKTLTLHGQGHHARARAELQHAVVLAEATRVVRLLIDEGPVLAMLLRKLADSSPPESYVHRLLDHFVTAGPHMTAVAGAEAVLLSKKEKQVAIYISKGLTSQEIAEVMFVARSTINTHIQSIYAKLGVNKRIQAIEKLRKLRLI